MLLSSIYYPTVSPQQNIPELFPSTFTENILLRPRPLEQHSGSLLLLPLLPHRPPFKSLPFEIWSEIFRFALNSGPKHSAQFRWSLLTVCKTFHEIAQPMFYSHVRITTISSLEKFYKRLHTADQKWDSIRRIPYSTPGRWVQILDLSELQSETLLLDSILTQLFPLIPFLTQLILHPTSVLSRRAMASLTYRESSINIRVLEGISYVPTSCSPDEDPLVQLLIFCPNLEQVEVINQGLQPMDPEWEPSFASQSTPSFTPLHLPYLHTLSILSMPWSPLLLCLLHSPLPSLTKLTITPYDDIPYPTSLVSRFIDVHGEKLRSLLLFTPRTWPTTLRPSPPTLLQTSPNLKHLSLEMPLPLLAVPSPPSMTHPLQVLSIPRPNTEFWHVLEPLLPLMPSLRAIRARDLRWLRPGMTVRALEAGVQGELREWRRRLAPRGIRVLDADWRMGE